MKELLLVMWYMDYDDDIDSLIKYISLRQHKENIEYPDNIISDDIMGILWSVMVCTYGDYGTSPRYGWILKKYVPEIIDLWKEVKGG